MAEPVEVGRATLSVPVYSSDANAWAVMANRFISAQTEAAYWRMLSRGYLMTKGWRMAVLKEVSRIDVCPMTVGVVCLAVPPGSQPPAGFRWEISSLPQLTTPRPKTRTPRIGR